MHKAASNSPSERIDSRSRCRRQHIIRIRLRVEGWTSQLMRHVEFLESKQKADELERYNPVQESLQEKQERERGKY